MVLPTLSDPTARAMFGMGTWETMIILVVALVFLGPDKLPEVAKSLGKGLRTLRRAMSSVEYEVQQLTQPERHEPPKRSPAAATAAQDAVADPGTHPPHPDDIAFDAAEGDAAAEADPHAPPPDYDRHTEPDPLVPDPSGAVAAPHPFRATPPANVAHDDPEDMASEGPAAVPSVEEAAPVEAPRTEPETQAS